MNPFSAVGRALTLVSSRKENPIYSVLVSMGLRGPIWSQANFKAYADEGYNANTDVYACINKLVGAAKSINWKVYKRQKGAEQPVEQPEHPLALLIRRPNPRQSWANLISQFVGFEFVAGNSYLIRVGPSGNKPPKELWTMRPDRVSVKVGTKLNPIFGYEYTVGGDKQVFVPDRVIDGNPMHTVLHWMKFHPTNDWYGLSPIQAAARSVDQSNASQAHNLALLQNGAAPSGALISKERMDDAEFEKLRDQLETKWQGQQNAGKPLLLTGGMDWKAFGLSPREMDWLKGQLLSTRRICSIFGVAPELIGDAANKTYSNQKEARKALYMDTVLPFMDEIAGELNNWLVPLYGDPDLYLAYDRDEIDAIQEDRETIWLRGIAALKAGGITPNEFRRMIQLSPHKDPVADELYVSTHVIPTGEAPEGTVAVPADGAVGGGEEVTAPPNRITPGKPVAAVKPKPAAKPTAPTGPAVPAKPKKPSKKWRVFFSHADSD